MRLKYYLRGLGIGIVLATLLLSISFYFGKDSLAKRELSDQEIIERAKELGMVEGEKTKKTEVEEKSESKTEDTNKSEDTDVEEDVESKDTSKSEEDISEAKEKLKDGEISLEDAIESEEAREKADDTVAETTVSYVPFTIKAGASSEAVASDLHKAGLIDSPSKFSDYMNKLGVDNRIQSGSFYVKANSSYDDIIALLVNKEVRTTTPPKTEE